MQKNEREQRHPELSGGQAPGGKGEGDKGEEEGREMLTQRLFYEALADCFAFCFGDSQLCCYSKNFLPLRWLGGLAFVPRWCGRVGPAGSKG